MTFFILMALRSSLLLKSLKKHPTATYHRKMSERVTKELNEELAFVENVNALTGERIWDLKPQSYDYSREVARAAFADMLHDSERNRKYDQALGAAISNLHSQGKPAHVLDIGTGTGLLSMMAARHGADWIVACEQFPPMAKCALEVIALNGFQDAIKVVPKRSTDLIMGIDLPERANILVTEVFDTELIGEGALDIFKHAHQFLLSADSIVVPHSAIVYAQVVEGPLIREWNRLKDIVNLDGELLLSVPESVKKCEGSAELHDVQMSQLPLDKLKFLSDPIEIDRFDWCQSSSLNYNGLELLNVKAKKDGTAQGVFVWWELIMYEPGDGKADNILSCAPFWAHPDVTDLRQATASSIPWRDHWMQAVYYLPRDQPVSKDKDFTLIANHDEFSYWFRASVDATTGIAFDEPGCSCGLHSGHSRTRIGQLNDVRRTKKCVIALEKHVTSGSVVLTIGEGFYMALAALKMNAEKVYILDQTDRTRMLVKAFIDSNGLAEKAFVIKSLDELQAETGSINLVISEPYFQTSILPWDHLVMLQSLRKAQSFLSSDCQIIPSKAIIKMVAVKFKDLHKIRCALESCEGFLMAPFDTLINSACAISDLNVEAQPLWEYPSIAVSEPVEVLTVDLLKDISTINEDVNIDLLLEKEQTCNGIAFWVDWCLTSKDTISTGPVQNIVVAEVIQWDMHVKQGVSILGASMHTDKISTNFKYNATEGRISFKIL